MKQGERGAAGVERRMHEILEGEPLITLKYMGIYDNISLEPINEVRGQVLLALAARVGRARLIDNIPVILDD